MGNHDSYSDFGLRPLFRGRRCCRYASPSPGGLLAEQHERDGDRQCDREQDYVVCHATKYTRAVAAQLDLKSPRGSGALPGPAATTRCSQCTVAHDRCSEAVSPRAYGA